MKEMSAAKKILFMRAFGGLAWADHRVDPAEREFLERMSGRLHFSEADRVRLDRMLAKPMNPRDAQRLLRDLGLRVLDARERQVLLAELRALAEADGDFSSEEREFIAQLEASMGAGGALKRLFASPPATKETPT